MKALKDNIKEKLNRFDLSPEDIFLLMQNDYESIKDIIDEFIDNLSIGIADFIDVFEPDAIALGGSFIHFKDILLPKLLNKLHDGKKTFNGDIPDIFVAEYGNDAGIIGATLFE